MQEHKSILGQTLPGSHSFPFYTTQIVNLYWKKEIIDEFLHIINKMESMVQGLGFRIFDLQHEHFITQFMSGDHMV
jgi:hypothetical protein